jgi:hypothetical protein
MVGVFQKKVIEKIWYIRCQRYGGMKQIGSHNRSENGRSARVALCSHPTYTLFNLIAAEWLNHLFSRILSSFTYCHRNCLFSPSPKFLQKWVERTGNNATHGLYSWAAISACLRMDCLQDCSYMASVVGNIVEGMWYEFSNFENWSL